MFSTSKISFFFESTALFELDPKRSTRLHSQPKVAKRMQWSAWMVIRQFVEAIGKEHLNREFHSIPFFWACVHGCSSRNNWQLPDQLTMTDDFLSTLELFKIAKWGHEICEHLSLQEWIPGNFFLTFQICDCVLVRQHCCLCLWHGVNHQCLLPPELNQLNVEIRISGQNVQRKLELSRENCTGMRQHCCLHLGYGMNHLSLSLQHPGRIGDSQPPLQVPPADCRSDKLLSFVYFSVDTLTKETGDSYSSGSRASQGACSLQEILSKFWAKTPLGRPLTIILDPPWAIHIFAPTPNPGNHPS